jgi:hypothetical protein
MRCPDCNKFVGLEMDDPDLEDIDISDNGEITATVRIARKCADCGNDMKEALLEMSDEVPQDIADRHDGEKHKLSIEETAVEPIEEGGGRYAISYYGATVHYAVRCSCQKDDADPIYESSMEEKVAASEMDEMV